MKGDLKEKRLMNKSAVNYFIFEKNHNNLNY